MSNYIIRNMTLDEVRNIAVKWAEEEGWNPGLYDAVPFFNTDPKGFFIGLLDNVPVACKSAVAYDDTFGFMGFYIVKKGYRGMGYGIKIWKHAFNQLGSRNSGMDGVVAQQPNYMKSGYKLAYRNIRFEGTAKKYADKTTGIVPFKKENFDELVRYDANLFPTQRSVFLDCWITQPDTTTLVSVYNGRLNGYGTIRKCVKGYKIGPLLADNDEIAWSLFMGLNKSVHEGAAIYFDTPEVNPKAVRIAESTGMKYSFETARMYNRAVPKIDLQKIFGVTTFELG